MTIRGQSDTQGSIGFWAPRYPSAVPDHEKVKFLGRDNSSLVVKGLTPLIICVSVQNSHSKRDLTKNKQWYKICCQKNWNHSDTL